MSTAFRISLDGAQQVPVVSTTASGLGTAIFDSTANTLSYEIDIFGLDWGPFTGVASETPSPLDDVIDAHFHNEARGVNGNVVLGWKSQDDDYVPSSFGPGFTKVTGLWETTDAGGSLNAFIAALAGATLGSDVPLYANIHTNANGGGEIRGQLVTIATDSSEIVNGSAGADILPGLGGDDTIDAKTKTAFSLSDRVDGGAGADTLVANASTETNRVKLQFTAPGAGSFNSNSDNFGVDFTSIENVNFIGGSSNDEVDTRLAPLTGGTLDGGAGRDLWQADLSTLSSDISFTFSTSTSLAAVGLTSILNFEQMRLATGAGNDTITGGSFSDTIATGGGDDTINPGNPAGNTDDGDFDDIDGGEGTDTLVIDTSAETQPFSFNFSGLAFATQGQVTSQAFDYRVFFKNMEKVSFTGGSGNDQFSMVSALPPAGGTLNGGAGIDQLSINLTSIVAGIIYTHSQATSLAAAGLTSIVDIEKIDITTGGGDDTITGGAHDDTIKTGGGSDTVNAGLHQVGGSFDLVDGEGGSDTLVIDASAETQSVTATVDQFQTYQVTSVSDNIGVAALNFERVNFAGGSGNDTVTGRSGNDVMIGSLGIDTAIMSGTIAANTVTRAGSTITIVGPGGTDTLTGFERVQFSNGTFDIGPVSNDFNGDGKSDLLFSNLEGAFGVDYEWQLNNRSLLAEGAIDLFDKDFHVQVTGDFDRDGKTDVLFQNPDTGGVWEWRLNGTSILSQQAVDVGDPSFHLLGTGDFNGDFRDDVLFRNDAGSIYMWQMNGFANTGLPVGLLDPSWHVQGAGDFNGDGKDDILLRNVSANPNENSAFFLWQMNGNLIQAEGGIERPDIEWKTLGIGDFNGDGKDDFAVRNVSATPDNGAVWIYLMDGTTILSQGAAGIADPANWHIQLIGDLDGNGKDDILYRNNAGAFYSWNMDGTTIATEGLLQGAAQQADLSFTVVQPHWDLV